MKRRLISVIIALVLLGGTAYAAAGITTYTLTDIDYGIMINGEAMTWTDAVPMQYNGRTMLPLRAMAEALGVDITWNEAKGQAEVNTIDLEKLKNSCVMTYTSNGTAYARASGVIIDYDKILTCYHVVKGDTIYAVQYDDSTTDYKCTLAKTAPSEDAAILTPEVKTVKPVKIGDSDEVKVGDKVYVISCPEGKKNTILTGKVTYEKYINTNENGTIKGFAISAVTQPGSSGGACFNMRGELIGIVEAGDSEGAFIVPINNARKALAN